MSNFVQKLKEQKAALEITVEVYDDIIEQLIEAANDNDDEKFKSIVEHYENFKKSL